MLPCGELGDSYLTLDVVRQASISLPSPSEPPSRLSGASGPAISGEVGVKFPRIRFVGVQIVN